MKFGLAVFLMMVSGITNAENPAVPGSGYADLENNIINYEYWGFGGFHMRIRDQKILWRGYVGYFKDIVSLVEPQISKVSNNVYFASWPTVGDNGDNVVWNFDRMKVFAHLGGGQAFKMIHGVIHCHNTKKCTAPPDEVMPPQLRAQKLMENVREHGYDSPRAALAPTRDMGPADILGMNELAGKTLSYDTSQGSVTLEFDSQQILVTDTINGRKTHSIHATRIAQAIYFVSWGGDFGGNHIVFNAATMKVYDHIQNDGTRVESIYDASCFQAAGEC